MGGGGNRGGGSSLAPVPTSPTRWLYNRTGEAVQLQEYGHYTRTPGDPNRFQLQYDNPAVGAGLYTSPELAAQKNPKAWLYDAKGKTVKQIFRGGEGPDDTFDASLYNLGPDSTPYRHWFDIYGVDQGYAPTSTALPEGMYDAANKAPLSPNFVAPVPLNETDPNLNVQGDASATADVAAAKAQAKKRRTSKTEEALTLLSGGSDTTGSASGTKSLLGE